MDKCSQCNKCSLICPHAAVRPFLMSQQELETAPATFKDGSRAALGGGVLDNYSYRIQVRLGHFFLFLCGAAKGFH